MNDQLPTPLTVLEEARRLVALGIAVTKVRARDKRPTDKGWQSAPAPDDAQLVKWFPDDESNLGVRTGAISGGLIDLDCDNEKFARYLAAVSPGWLLAAPRYRRGDRPHILLPIEPLPDYAKYTLGKMTIVEVRGDGHQSVVPPSVHPSGDPYVWEVPPHRPEPRTPAELMDVLRTALTAFVVGESWTEGRRHETALALGGWLASMRVPEDVAFAITAAICTVNADDEREARAGDVRDSYGRVESGLPVVGFSKLCELIGKDGQELLQKLWPQATSRNPNSPSRPPGDVLGDAYVAHEGALFRRVGTDLIPLSNFVATIDEEEVFDDGFPEVRRTFTISGSTSSGTPLGPARVSAREYGPLNWVPEHFGADAVIAPGPVAKDHLRAAIQSISRNRRKRTTFGHLGWRDGDGGPVFIHGGGGISRSGLDEDISVSLPSRLMGYRFATPVVGPAESVRQSLRLLDAAPDQVTFPLYAATIVPIVLDPVDFIVFLLGETGTGKTVISSLCSQHFGAALDARSLPASWSSTANSLEVLASTAKNVLLVVDDFQPSGGISALQLNREADRLIRAQGNQAGRSRLRPDGTFVTARYPRGLILATGEAVPTGDSLRARMLIVRLVRGKAGLDWELVSELQTAGADGVLESATAAFIQWLAPQLNEVRAEAAAFVRTARRQSSGDVHRRTPGMFASIQYSLRTWFRFARECGAVDASREQELLARMDSALELAAADQQHYRETEDPVERFFQLLAASVAGGSSHVASARGGMPSPKHGGRAWGWSGDDFLERPVGRRCMGWVEGESLFLLPELAYVEAALMARREGHELGIDKSTLGRQLDERGLLVSRDHARQRTTVRRTLAGAQRTVWHVRAASVLDCDEVTEDA